MRYHTVANHALAQRIGDKLAKILSSQGVMWLGPSRVAQLLKHFPELAREVKLGMPIEPRHPHS